MNKLFDMSGKVALVTGGAGLLGKKHAEAIIEQGGEVILADYDLDGAVSAAKELGNLAHAEYINVLDKESIHKVVEKYEKIDVLINNAAKDPKVKSSGDISPDTRFETMSEDFWSDGIETILRGAFLCSQAVTSKMSKSGGGVILNISSDLGVISPDQRIYQKDNTPEEMQNVKPITYSVAKWGVIGMTKYLATYFAKKNIRVNCLSPGGVFVDHPEKFVSKLSNLIPMGRMAHADEYKGAIIFLCSDASSYMTGANVIIDGGRTVW